MAQGTQDIYLAPSTGGGAASQREGPHKNEQCSVHFLPCCCQLSPSTKPCSAHLVHAAVGTQAGGPCTHVRTQGQQWGTQKANIFPGDMQCVPGNRSPT